MSRRLSVKIFRFDAGKEPRYESYNIPFEHGMRAIDAIHYIQENFDGTLAFRANCNSGRCGSDAVEVDGMPVLACKHEIKKGTKEIAIRPLKAFPVIKDLVVDLSKTMERASDIPCFVPNKKGNGFWKLRQEDVQEVRELRKCIECFICHDVCHVIRDHEKDYIGPRFAVKAAALDKHPMDALKNRYKILENKGIWLCNISRCCQENCPEKIRITDDAIIFSKERNVDDSSLFRKRDKK